MQNFDPENLVLSHSRLCDLANSPAYFKYRFTADEEKTDAMLIGSLVGCRLLEDHKFEEKYEVLQQGFNLKSDANKERWATIIAAGKQPVKAEMLKTVDAMKAALLANETSRQVLRMDYEGFNEMKLEWVDKRTGIKMKGFVDRFITPKKDLVIDLKCGADNSPGKFKRKFFDFDYDQQAAIYFDGLRAMGYTPQRVAYIAVESTPPYDIAVFNVPEDVLLKGREKYEKRLDFFMRCRDKDLWHMSYDIFSETGIHDITVPKWV